MVNYLDDEAIVLDFHISHLQFTIQKVVEDTGVEPMTFCLQSRRSTN